MARLVQGAVIAFFLVTGASFSASLNSVLSMFGHSFWYDGSYFPVLRQVYSQAGPQIFLFLLLLRTGRNEPSEKPPGNF